MATRYLTAAQVADLLAMHPKTVARHTRSGVFAAFAVNVGDEAHPTWRYHPGRLDRWLESRRTAAA